MKIAKTDLVFLCIAVVSGLLCYLIGGSLAVSAAFSEAAMLMVTILPPLAGGLLIAGLAQQLVNRERIGKLLGAESGLRGLAIATLAGVLTPGGPFTSFPLVYALWIAGAEAGTLIAYIVSWALLGFTRLIVWELPLMGLEFTSIRVLACLPLPIFAGLIARRLSRLRFFRLETESKE